MLPATASEHSRKNTQMTPGHEVLCRVLALYRGITHRPAMDGVTREKETCAHDFGQKPASTLRLVDPVLDQPRGGDVAILVAHFMGYPKKTPLLWWPDSFATRHQDAPLRL
jgi:hypothetical protein